MAVNRFNTPVESEYISQYVPIPFEQLYALGKAYNDRLDKTYEQMASHIEKYKDFQSPSAVDTARWNQIMQTNVIDRVNALMTNPDALKTQAGRAEVQNIINSMPYGEMNELKQSRDAMLQRQKLEQQLSLAGKFNPLWHGMDYANYSTDKQGVFNDLNLVPYMSEVDLVEPYVSSLKDSFLYSDGSYDYTGVLPETTDAQLRENMSAIYNTPQAQMHIRALMKQGLSEEDAKKTFEDSIYLAGRQYARKNREANAFAQIQKTYSYKNKGKENNTASPLYLTEQLEYQGLNAYNYGRNFLISNSPEYKAIKEQLKSEDPAVKEEAMKKLQELDRNYTPNKMFRNVLMSAAQTSTSPESYMMITNENLPYAVNSVMNTFGSEVRNADVSELLQKSIPGVTSDFQTTDFGKRRIIYGGEGLELMSDVISNVAGLELAGNQRRKVMDALSSGKFSKMIVLSNNRQITIPMNTERGQTAVSYQEVKVAISDEDVSRLGITDLDMRLSGATPLHTQSNTNESATDTTSGDINGDGERSEEKFSTSRNKSGKPSKKYWILSLGSRLPKTGEGLNAESINQQYQKMNMSTTDSSDLYTDVQMKSYN